MKTNQTTMKKPTNLLFTLLLCIVFQLSFGLPTPPKGEHDGMNDSKTNLATNYDRVRSYKIVNYNPNSVDSNRVPVSIDCNSLPSSLITGTSIEVSVSYSADQNRDVVVELWNSRWLGQGRKTVSAGSGTTTVTINLNNAPAAGSNYLLKASVRPIGAAWQQNIKVCNKRNITLSTSVPDPDPDPNPDPDPDPVAVSIDCNSLPSSIVTGTSIEVSVSYSADQNRDVVVELWNSRWLGQGKKTVSAGSGTTTVTINLNNAPAAGSNYLFKASVRPVGGGWQQNIKVCNKRNITLSTSDNGGGDSGGGDSGGGDNGGNVGAPDNGGDTGCTGQDTFDQGVKIVPNANSWTDSYKANGYCFCKSSFDHGVGNFKININGQGRNIRAICDELKKHPKFRNLRNGDRRYNTIQCGNEPGHGDAITIQGKRIKDEKVCPGRVDQGSKGCKCKGPKFDMKWLSSRKRFGGNGKAPDVLKSSNISIYPNPVNADGESFLSIYSEKDELATISIHDLRGTLITSIKHNGVKGTTSAIEITSLIEAVSSATGTYIISYKTRTSSKSNLIIVK